MNVVLIGMRGSGKSTVGSILARELERDLIEMDELIVQKAGMSIAKLVEKHGWGYFRDLEEKVTEEVSQLDNLVISTGGGVVIRPQNIANLKHTGVIFFLFAEIDTLYARIGEDTARPSLTGEQSLKDDLQKVWQERRKLYCNAADEVIDTEEHSPTDVAQYINTVLQEK